MRFKLQRVYCKAYIVSPSNNKLRPISTGRNIGLRWLHGAAPVRYFGKCALIALALKDGTDRRVNWQTPDQYAVPVRYGHGQGNKR